MAQTLSVKAPVNGPVDVKVSTGDSVSQGGLLATQTMTKTETQVSAPISGRVKVIAPKGVSLMEGDTIVEIEY